MVLGIYGASGLGMEYFSLANYINEQNALLTKLYFKETDLRWTEIIFVDDDPEKNGTTLIDLPVLSFQSAVEKYGKDGIEFIIAIGEPNVKDIVFKKLLDSGCEVTNILNPDAIKPASFTCGKGLLWHRGSGFPPAATFGNNILVQGGCIMGHGIKVGDNVVLSSHSFIGGDSIIGKNTYVGPGALLRNGITIGENVVIGMGSVVVKDVPDNVVVCGNPARILRTNDKGRVFSK